jgi:hypothetical protein
MYKNSAAVSLDALLKALEEEKFSYIRICALSLCYLLLAGSFNAIMQQECDSMDAKVAS